MSTENESIAHGSDLVDVGDKAPTDVESIIKADHAEAVERLARLRSDRERLAEKIRAAVAEVDKTTRLVNALTPRTRKTKSS